MTYCVLTAQTRKLIRTAWCKLSAFKNAPDCAFDLDLSNSHKLIDGLSISLYIYRCVSCSVLSGMCLSADLEPQKSKTTSGIPFIFLYVDHWAFCFETRECMCVYKLRFINHIHTHTRPHARARAHVNTLTHTNIEANVDMKEMQRKYRIKSTC